MPSAHLGIDFGTSHTVAVLNRGGMAVPLLFDSSPILPSAVYADPGTGLVVGTDAVNSARLEPARFEPNPKRRVDDGRVLLGDKEFEVEELFAAVLARVRRDCDRVTGSAVSDVTLTHPAAWGAARRLVLADAAKAAGFGDARLMPEPVAAATYFTHVLRHDVPAGSSVVVADLGGGTFDASVVAVGDDGLEVLSVDGIENLGGVDVDYALIGLLTERFGGDEGWRRLLDPRSTDDRRLLRGLYEDVRSAKERLSRQVRVDLPVPLVGSDTHFTREELETVTRPLLERAVRVTRAVIRASRLPDEQVAGVFLVGGASRMPLVANMLHQALGTAPVVLEQPELVVAQGATVRDPRPGSKNSPTATPVPQQRPPDAPSVTVAVSAAPVTTPRSRPVPPPDRPPMTVRIAHALMWLNGAFIVLWLGCYAYVMNYQYDPFTTDDVDRYPWLIAIMPIGIVSSAAILCLAAVPRRLRTRFTRNLATVASIATSIVAVVVAILAAYVSNFVHDDIDTLRGTGLPLPTVMTMTTVAATVNTGLALPSVALLWIGPGFEWFATRTPTAAKTATLPSPVRVARGLMWATMAISAAATVAFTGTLVDTAITADADFSDYFVDADIVPLLVVFPVLLLATAAFVGVTAARLNIRSSIVRRLAVAATATATGVSLAAAVASRPTRDGNVLVFLLIAVIVTVVSACLLSTRSARQAFAAPTRSS